MSERSLRSFRVKLATAYRRLGELGLVSGSSGNVSLRLKGIILITPTGVPWPHLRAKQIVVMDEGGQVRGPGWPSSEWRLHVAIYRARPEVGAVVHTHSPYATALAAAERELLVVHDEGRLILGERIPLAKPAPPGSWELAQNAVAALGSGKAVLLARHGAVTVGRDLAGALLLAEKVEEAARLGLLLGGRL